jgi:hypothetical protein
MELDLRWEIQEPVTIAGGDSLQPKSSVAAWQTVELIRAILKTYQINLHTVKEAHFPFLFPENIRLT